MATKAGRVIPDPPVRADGRCYVCLKPRDPERSRKYAGDVATLDPFCSNVCARAFHGQPNLDEQGAESRKRLLRGRNQATGVGFKHGTRESYRLCACDLCVAAVKGARV